MHDVAVELGRVVRLERSELHRLRLDVVVINRGGKKFGYVGPRAALDVSVQVSAIGTRGRVRRIRHEDEVAEVGRCFGKSDELFSFQPHLPQVGGPARDQFTGGAVPDVRRVGPLAAASVAATCGAVREFGEFAGEAVDRKSVRVIDEAIQVGRRLRTVRKFGKRDVDVDQRFEEVGGRSTHRGRLGRRQTGVALGPTARGTGGDIHVVDLVGGGAGFVGEQGEGRRVGHPRGAGRVVRNARAAASHDQRTIGEFRRHELVRPTVRQGVRARFLSHLGVRAVLRVEVEGLVGGGSRPVLVGGNQPEVVGDAFGQAFQHGVDSHLSVAGTGIAIRGRVPVFIRDPPLESVGGVAVTGVDFAEEFSRRRLNVRRVDVADDRRFRGLQNLVLSDGVTRGVGRHDAVVVREAATEAGDFDRRHFDPAGSRCDVAGGRRGFVAVGRRLAPFEVVLGFPSVGIERAVELRRRSRDGGRRVGGEVVDGRRRGEGLVAAPRAPVFVGGDESEVVFRRAFEARYCDRCNVGFSRGRTCVSRRRRHGRAVAFGQCRIRSSSGCLRRCRRKSR